MQIPCSDSLTTGCLSRIFNNTSATYKFFWFLSILETHAQTKSLKFSVWDLVIRMVAYAWYPIHYFRLSFGKNDSLSNIATELHRVANIPIDASKEDVIKGLKSQLNNKEVRKNLKILLHNVPYRFLSPWINTSDNNLMVKRSQTLENECLYSLMFEGEDMVVSLNPKWDVYLHLHYKILIDFTYWNLVQFLQIRNPNVPAIPNKLRKPEARNTLTKQHQFWDEILEVGGPVKCIYTGAEIYPGKYDLDHFMPWSFVSHDLIWNLIPTDGSVNCSKSNKIPDLKIYLPKLASLQHHAVKTIVTNGLKSHLEEDYLSLNYTVNELAKMSLDKFRDVYERTFNPLSQIAVNMGFELWK